MDTTQLRMPSDLELARQCKPKPIDEAAASLNIPS